jgi:hypothetical protein
MVEMSIYGVSFDLVGKQPQGEPTATAIRRRDLLG